MIRINQINLKALEQVIEDLEEEIIIIRGKV